MTSSWFYKIAATLLHHHFTVSMRLLSPAEATITKLHKIFLKIQNYHNSGIKLATDLVFDLHVTVHHDTFLIIKPTRHTNFSNLFLEWNSSCFRHFLCPSSGVFLLYERQWYTSHRFADSLRAGLQESQKSYSRKPNSSHSALLGLHSHALLIVVWRYFISVGASIRVYCQLFL
jgi:hypothetical protein